MDMIISKYYKGYEDEPEIQFITTQASGRKIILKLWEGFFDKIMYAISPDPDGWHSLAYYYHLDIGWYEESPWQIPNVSEALEQLQKIDTHDFDKETMEIYKEVCSLLDQAVKEKKAVWIVYE